MKQRGKLFFVFISWLHVVLGWGGGGACYNIKKYIYIYSCQGESIGTYGSKRPKYSAVFYCVSSTLGVSQYFSPDTSNSNSNKNKSRARAITVTKANHNHNNNHNSNKNKNNNSNKNKKYSSLQLQSFYCRPILLSTICWLGWAVD